MDKDKEKVLITDFLEVSNKYLRSHSSDRKRDYEREGFEVKVENG